MEIGKTYQIVLSGKGTYEPGEYNTYEEALAALGGKTGFIKETTSFTQEDRFVNVTTTTTATTTTTTNYLDTLERQRYVADLKLEDSTADLGNFVTDVSLITYIRPQIIRIHAQGLKASTRYYVFFDGENMSSYVTPRNPPTGDIVQTDPFGYVIYNISPQLPGSNTEVTIPKNNYLTSMGEEGDPVFSDENGEVICFLRLPESGKKFTTGSKEVLLSDNPTNSPEATSYARAMFYASGLNVTKQDTILSTRNAQVIRELETETKEENRSTVSSKTTTSTTTQVDFRPGGIYTSGKLFEANNPSCIAYSFLVDFPGETGIFLSSVDVFIESMHPTLGVWFEVREMSSGGGITRRQVPGSEVWMKRNDPRIVLTEDGTQATRVNFKSPIFLYNNTQYAFVVHTEGLNPDTYFWISRIGDTDLITGLPHTSRGLYGTLYTTNNNLNWDIVPDADLKIRFNRAVFNTVTPGVATFVNEDREYLVADSISATNFFRKGEPVRGSEKITLTITGGADTVAANDIIQDAITGANCTVIDVDGTDIYTDGHGLIYSLGANVEIIDGSNTSSTKDIDATVATVDFGLATVYDYDIVNSQVILESSNGKFFEGAKIISLLPDRYIDVTTPPEEPPIISGEFSRVPSAFLPFTEETEYVTGGKSSIETAVQNSTFTLPFGQAPGSSGNFPEFTISSFYTYEFSHVTPLSKYIEPDVNTTVDWTIRCVTNTTEDSPTQALIGRESDFNTVKNILSRSQEISLLGGEKSIELTATLNTDNDHLTPVIDHPLTSFIIIDNILNSNTSGETEPTGGELEAKYISRQIYLDPSDVAEDLLVQLLEYRPLTTEVEVYVRFKHPYDSQPLSEKQWIQMSAEKSAFSSTDRKQNFIDFVYTIPEEYQTGQFGEFEYVLTGDKAVLSADEMVANTDYVIRTIGTTDFEAFGASNNEIGLTFTANSAGTGTGTVSLADVPIYTGFSEYQIKVGLLGESKAVYPKIAELRSIALQM